MKWINDINDIKIDFSLEFTKELIYSLFQELENNYYNTGNLFALASFLCSTNRLHLDFNDNKKELLSQLSLDLVEKTAQEIYQKNYSLDKLTNSFSAQEESKIIFQSLIIANKNKNCEDTIKMLDTINCHLTTLENVEYQSIGLLVSLLNYNLNIGNDKTTDEITRKIENHFQNQDKNGWINFSNQDGETISSFYFIATNMSNLYNYSLAKGDEIKIQLVLKPIRRFMHKFEITKKPFVAQYEHFNEKCNEPASLLAYAQISRCWINIYKNTLDNRYLNAFLKMNDVCKHVYLNSGINTMKICMPSKDDSPNDSIIAKELLYTLIDEYKVKESLLNFS